MEIDWNKLTSETNNYPLPITCGNITSEEEDQPVYVPVELDETAYEDLDKIFATFPNSWFSFDCFLVEAAVRYARSKVGFNVSIKNDLNMRFFEALSYGTCLVTNTDVDGIKETGLKDGIDFLGYTTPAEAVNKIQWALANPLEREKIAKSGHSKVRDMHTYNHRIKNIKEVIYG